MDLLFGWKERLGRAEAEPPPGGARFVIPLAPKFFAEQINFVADADAAHQMVEVAYQRSIAFAGLDTEFKYDEPPVDMPRGKKWTDPRSTHPLLLSLTMAEPEETGIRLYRFVVDLRCPEVLPAIRGVLRLPVCFVGHFLQAELFCLWQLGLEAPDQLWDTWACEKALRLGMYHAGYRTGSQATEAEQIQAKEDVEEEKASYFSLLGTCQRYGIDHAFEGDKDRLQRSFLTNLDGHLFSQEQIEYAAADAVAAAQLYLPQVQAAAMHGVLNHLATVEMPWVTTNAEIIWRGMRISPEKRNQVRAACAKHEPVLRARLRELGIENPRSHSDLKQFFESRGCLDAFRRNGKYSFNKDQLYRVAHLDSSIKVIRAARRVLDLRADPIMRLDLIGADGRIHPDHRQLGAETGRQTSRWPNVLGLDRVLRPMIVPNPGRAIGEVDLSQIEVGIAAAVYHDDELVRMFNTGDVYSAMAQHFHADQLSAEDRGLSGAGFKRACPQLRNQMKTCTLGIIYGLTTHGLATYLGSNPIKAKRLQDRFMGMFPALKKALADASNYGTIRGYATTNTGLRRLRINTGASSRWERNWMTNHPVQGSAAVVFKAAGNRLSRLYRRHDAWIIVPLHDAFIFEAEKESLDEVAELTARVMRDTVQEYFPQLRPQVEANIGRSDCWNKDGKADAFEKWLEDPTHTV